MAHVACTTALPAREEPFLQAAGGRFWFSGLYARALLWCCAVSGIHHYQPIFPALSACCASIWLPLQPLPLAFCGFSWYITE